MRLINGDCLSVLADMDPVRMIFMDPPDNVGKEYTCYEDKLDAEEYLDFIDEVIRMSMSKAEVVWISYNTKHTFSIGRVLDDILYGECGRWEAKPCVQTYTFYQHNRHDLGAAHRPLVRLMKRGTQLYPDRVRVPSWRQLHGDKRADPRGKVPGDVFDFPRVVGNSRQRRKWHTTQLHEGLYEQCIKLCCTPGDTVCDLFAGTGTLARVAGRCEVDAMLVEMDRGYCEKIAEEHGLLKDGDEFRSEHESKH